MKTLLKRQNILLALRMLLRDWRAGELNVLIAALIVAVTCFSGVAFFTDRISQALKYQAGELLGADLRIVANHRLSESYSTLARQKQLSTAQFLDFRSMVIAGKKTRLAEIKAVNQSYPLRGNLRITKKRFTSETVVNGIPETGKIWVEAQLLSLLQLDVGDDIEVGSKTFVIDAIVTYEPDRSGDMYSIAPRVLMNMQDIHATELIQEGSRIHYGLLVAGDSHLVDQYRKQLSKKLKRGERIESVEDARQEVRIALQRAKQFLGLAAIVSLIICCVAIALSARRYAQRHMKTCAIMRCVGAIQSHITRLFIIQLVILAGVSSLFAAVLGYLSQYLLSVMLDNLVIVELPQPSLTPLFIAIIVGVVSLLGFALPPVLGLRNIPTIQVIRNEFNTLPIINLSSYIGGLAAFAGLVYWQAQDIKLGTNMIIGLLATILLALAISSALIKIVRKVGLHRGLVWRFGVGSILRGGIQSSIQVLAFGVGMMVLLLLTLVRGDLLDTWQNKLPNDAANRFVINIQPPQLEAVQQFFKQQQLSQVKLHPMVRGRLTHISGKALISKELDNDRAQRLASREFNLSWSDQLLDDNKIVAGKWWGEGTDFESQFSVEEGIAKTLGIKLGDTLDYSIAGETLRGTVSSLRSVQWDTFKPNFFVLTPPSVLNHYPVSYITSFYLAEHQYEVLDALVKKFPNLTVVDISAIMNQVRNIIDRVSMAVEYVFLFTLLAGMTVLYAAIQSTQDQRIQDNAILRALGASKIQLKLCLAIEFGLLGLFAGIMAALLSSVTSYLLATQVLDLAYQANLWIWVVGMAGGSIGVCIAGLWGTRQLFNKPPLQILMRT